jgi:hypothetical protein
MSSDASAFSAEVQWNSKNRRRGISVIGLALVRTLGIGKDLRIFRILQPGLVDVTQWNESSCEPDVRSERVAKSTPGPAPANRHSLLASLTLLFLMFHRVLLISWRKQR